MPTVLNNYPDRVQPDVDGCIARIDCGEIGRRYVLELDGAAYLVAVADCAQPRDVQHLEYAFGGSWLADVDAMLWDDLPRYPQQARLWPVRAWQMERRRWSRIE